MNKQKIVIVSCIVLILVFAIGASLYQNQQSKKHESMAQESTSLFVREHSQTLGSKDAKVILVEFFDPACETCASFYPLVKNLMAENPGKIKLVLRYAPFHDGADYFVKLLEAARKQGKYFETLEVLYQTQQYWASHHTPNPELIWQILPQTNLGLDLEKLRRDIDNPEIAKIIEQDLADANALDVRKTPGFFVNGKPLTTFGYEQLKELVQLEIEKAY